MNTTFLAVVIIMVLLVGFVLVILQSLAGSAGVRIRADMVKLLGSYDKVIETKSHEIRRLQAEADKLRANPADRMPEDRGGQAPSHTAQAPIPKAASYRSGDFGGGYYAIREHFRLSDGEQDALVSQVAQARDEETPGRGEAAARLRSDLSFDTVFRLSQMPGDRQLEILDTSLDDEGWALLRDYCQQHTDRPFDTGRFCHWLTELEDLEGRGLSVRLGGQKTSEDNDGICEGIQIVSGGRLYDFSIQEREIG